MKTYDELLAENEALAAKLSNVISAWNGHDYDAINAEINKTPQQCLTEIKAKEAVKGWWACWEWVDSDDKDKPTLIPAINQYEAKVRQDNQSGAWLKDSNVNGGKRQGGEK